MRRRCIHGKIGEHWAVGLVNEGEGRTQDSSLELPVIWYPERPSQFERYPQRSRRPDLFSMFADQADAGGRNAFSFDVVCKRADGARTEWSDRHQERDINAVPLEQPPDLGA